ncbi:hypothetical protein ACFYPN_16135 [Streptomyces sp. NPDC005576]|uniref:hypothetical protein n=1 Tax=unclassified Streptomyces TaxID=2593676 RepID=UPI0033E9086B
MTVIRPVPNPYGCRWCGTDRGDHGRRWVVGHDVHQWVQPITVQILARMQTRRANRSPKEN